MSTHLTGASAPSFHDVQDGPDLAADPVPRLVATEAGLIRYANPSFCHMAGHKPGSLTGKRLKDLIAFEDPADAQDDRSVFLYAKATADPWVRAIVDGAHDIRINATQTRFRFDWVDIEGERSYLIASQENPAQDNEIETVRSHPAALDHLVLALDRADHARTPLQPAFYDIEQESSVFELRAFLDLVQDVAILCNGEGTIVRAGQRLHSVLGYDTRHAAGTSFLDMIHTDDRIHMHTLWQCVVRDDGGLQSDMLECEARAVGADGTIRWMEWRLKRQADCIYILGRNVTENREQQQALMVQQSRLREAQAIGRMGHWSWAVGSDRLDWSAEIFRIFGVDPAAFTPSLTDLQKCIHRRDVGRMVQAFQRAMIERNTYDIDFRILRPNGTLRFIRCEGRCELDEQGDVVSLFGIMQDMTERIEYETDLRAAKEEAERAYSAKTQFLANMSHELRTPLNAIIGFSEMMQRQLLGPLGNDRYLEYIDGIRQSGEHLLDLIGDILDMSKIEAGKYTLDPELFNLSKVLQLAVHMVESRAHDDEVHLSVGTCDDDVMIRADRRAVLQVVLNLLSNAVKFTDPGGSVRLDCARDGDNNVTIQVTDTGIGIPSHMLGAVFRPFEQVASHYTRGHKGSGLGLAISKDLVELHGGSMGIASTVGVGTTVTIRLPLSVETPAENKISEAV